MKKTCTENIVTVQFKTEIALIGQMYNGVLGFPCIARPAINLTLATFLQCRWLLRAAGGTRSIRHTVQLPL